MAVTDTLSTIGAGAFGSSMPLLAPTWTTGQPTADADGMTLTLAAGAWQSPLAGYVRTPAQVAERSGVFLRRSNGGGVPAAARLVATSGRERFGHRLTH